MNGFIALSCERLYVLQWTDGHEEIRRTKPTPEERRQLEARGTFRIVTFHSEFSLPLDVALKLFDPTDQA